MQQVSIKSPLLEVISSLTVDTPPCFLAGLFSSLELTDVEYLKLQEWCGNNSKLKWSTGISIIEAADKIVFDAVDNGNIFTKDRQP